MLNATRRALSRSSLPTPLSLSRAPRAPPRRALAAAAAGAGLPSAPRGAPLPDHYAALGVAPAASLEEVKAAFRERAKALHPDLRAAAGAGAGGGGGAPAADDDGGAAFRAANDAYAVLGDAGRRRAYDAARAAALAGRRGAPAGGPSLAERNEGVLGGVGPVTARPRTEYDAAAVGWTGTRGADALAVAAPPPPPPAAAGAPAEDEAAAFRDSMTRTTARLRDDARARQAAARVARARAPDAGGVAHALASTGAIGAAALLWGASYMLFMR